MRIPPYITMSYYQRLNPDLLRQKRRRPKATEVLWGAFVSSFATEIPKALEVLPTLSPKHRKHGTI